MGAGLLGCGSKKECTLSEVSGLVISVIDQSSGNAICDATITIRDGSFEQSLVANSQTGDCSYAGANERPGTYEISVSRAGFLPATSDAVVHEDDSGCHVVPVFTAIALTPVGDSASDGGSFDAADN